MAMASLSIAVVPAHAQDGAALQEIRDLRALVEKQSKQLDALTEQVARLNHALATRSAVDGEVPVATAVAATPGGEFSIHTTRAESPTGRRHVVVKGETLTSIAKTYNLPLAELQKANKGVDERKLQIGQTLTIPTQPTAELPTETKENP